MPKQATWDTSNGQLDSQKYSPLTQISPQNVGKLKLAWQYHAGDMSAGYGKVPASVWSATPIFANDTLYLGTPFYRIIALNPGTGKVKSAYDPHAELKALTQPDMKNRGVAYWQSSDPKAGEACQKIVYIGTMAAKLHAIDADTGKLRDGFADHGTLDVNRWNKVNDKWPLSLLQPPTVYKNELIFGWAGKDWADEEAPPGSIFAVNAQTGKLDWQLNVIPADIRKQTGAANVWASMPIDRQRGILYVPVGASMDQKVRAIDMHSGKVLWSSKVIAPDISAPAIYEYKGRE